MIFTSSTLTHCHSYPAGILPRFLNIGDSPKPEWWVWIFLFFKSFLDFEIADDRFPAHGYVSAPPPKMVPFQLPPGVLRTPFGWLRRVRWQRRPARGWGASPAAGRGVEGGCNSRTWGACEAYMPCVWLSWILVQQFVDPNICTNLSEFTSIKIVEWVYVLFRLKELCNLSFPRYYIQHTHICIYLSIYLSIHPSIYLSIYLSKYIYIHVS